MAWPRCSKQSGKPFVKLPFLSSKTKETWKWVCSASELLKKVTQQNSAFGSVSNAMLIFEYQLKWVSEVSGRICWNPAWQAGRAGMHVINKAQKTSKRMSLSYSVAHTHTHTPNSVSQTSVCFLASGSFTTVASVLYLHFHLKRKQKHCQQSKINHRALCN